MSETPKRTLTAKLRIVALVAIGVAVAIFAFANLETTKVNLLFARVEMPRFLLILGVFFSGAAVGWLSKSRRKPKA